MGFKLVIFPASAQLTVTGVVGKLMRELKDQGTTAGMVDQMVNLEDCFNLVGLSEMLSINAEHLPPGDWARTKLINLRPCVQRYPGIA